MRHFNKTPILFCSFLFVTNLVLQGQDALEKSEQIVAQASAADPSIPRRDIPSAFEDISLLFGLKESDFAAMQPDDMRLKIAWVDLICGLPFGFPANLKQDSPEILNELKGPSPHRVYTYFDLKRRGNSVTPHLLQLASDMAETDFESSLIGLMPTLPGIEITPYLEYCRKLLRERPRSTQVVYAASLLSEHGNRDDISLIEETASIRPFYRATLQEAALLLRSRLGKKNSSGVPTVKTTGTQQDQRKDQKNQPEAKRAPTTPIQSEKQASAQPWSIIVFFILAALGLLCLLLKRRS